MSARGRPRGFDRGQALRRAMMVFWARGYEGASVGDLTRAMGINKPSLYAAFGCKEALFREAIALYDAEEGEPVQRAMDDAPTARAAIEAMLRMNARMFADPEKPPGCMIVLTALLGTPESGEVRGSLREARARAEANLEERISRGVAEGDVPETADVPRIAAFYTTVLHGLSVEACDRGSPEHLNGIVESAMAAWDAVAGGGTRRTHQV